ncbi:MAG TPA: hypothetical protein VIO83_10260 [Pseudomonas sp.]
MSKTIIDGQEITVKMPATFDPKELKARQDQAVTDYLNLPNITIFTIKAEILFQALDLLEQKLQEGYQRARETNHQSHPFVIPMFKKPEEVEAELNTVRQQVEADYRSEIAAQVDEAKQNLIIQRKAAIQRQEDEKKRKADEKLHRELEKEAADLFDSYLPK